MTKEEEAINNLNNLKNKTILYGDAIGIKIEGFKKLQEDIGITLNMLKEKDKIIDLMAEQLAGLTIWDNDKEEPLILADKEDVIKYFERKG